MNGIIFSHGEALLIGMGFLIILGIAVLLARR